MEEMHGDPCRFIKGSWIFMEIHGNSWRYVEIHRDSRRLLGDLCGSWRSIEVDDIHGSPYSIFYEIHGDPRRSMKIFYGDPWTSTEVHGDSLRSIEVHK